MRLSFGLLLIIFCTRFAAAEDGIADLKKRIEILEQQQQELLLETPDNSPKVNSFLRNNLTLGGFFEPSYSFMQGEDTPFQAASASNIMGLNISADFSPKLKFVSQFLVGLTIPTLNPHNDPRAVSLGLPKNREFGTYFFGALLSQGYLEYSISDKVNIQGGQGYVPFGYAAQQRELVLFVRRGGPQLIRTTELFAPLWSGFHFYQNFDLKKNVWGYNLYSFTRAEYSKMPGLGGRFWYGSDKDKYQTGLSVQSSKYYGHIEETVGWDLHFQLKDFIFTYEYAHHFSTGKPDIYTYYIEPSYFIYQEEILFYTFLDYAKSSLNVTASGKTALADPFQKYEYGMGINWLPTSYTRLRLGLTYFDYVHKNAVILGQKRDFAAIDVSAGVAF